MVLCVFHSVKNYLPFYCNSAVTVVAATENREDELVLNMMLSFALFHHHSNKNNNIKYPCFMHNSFHSCKTCLAGWLECNSSQQHHCRYEKAATAGKMYVVTDILVGRQGDLCFLPFFFTSLNSQQHDHDMTDRKMVVVLC